MSKPRKLQSRCVQTLTHTSVNFSVFCFATAHHTQFVDIGWKYLAHHHGSGNLTGNGTYVAYVSPDQQHVTIVIETMVATAGRQRVC